MKIKLFITSILLFFAVHCAVAQLPSIKLKNIEGQSVNTATLSNDGKPFIISFFASWCKPCLRELKAINEVYEDWQIETGVKLIAVSIDEGQNSQKVKPLVNSLGWEYEVLLDPNSDFSRALGVSMIPHAFIINGKGEIVEQHRGYTEGGEEKLIAKVKELLSYEK